jgi:hypothetical protein
MNPADFSVNAGKQNRQKKQNKKYEHHDNQLNMWA